MYLDDAAEPLMVAAKPFIKTVYLALFLQPPTETLVFGSVKLPESDALLNLPRDQKGIKNKTVPEV